MGKKAVCITLIVAFTLLIIMALVLIGLSVSFLDARLYGLQVNWNEIAIRNKLYRGGRYFLGLGHGFLKFPISNSAIVFSNSYAFDRSANASFADMDQDTLIEPTIVARTKEGVAISLDVFVHYKLTNSTDDNGRANDLFNIYTNLGGNWADFASQLVQATVRDVVSGYDMNDFFAQGEVISVQLQDELTKDFSDIWMSLSGAMIYNISMSDDLSTEIQSTAIMGQQALEASFLLQAYNTSAETSINNATIDAQIQISHAASYASIVRGTAQNQVAITNSTISTKQAMLQNITEQMQITSDAQSSAAEKLLTYMWIKTMQSDGVGSITLITDKPTPLQE